MEEREIIDDGFYAMMEKFACAVENILDGQDFKHSIEGNLIKIVDKENARNLVLTLCDEYRVYCSVDDLVQPELSPIQNEYFKAMYNFVPDFYKDTYVKKYYKYWCKFIKEDVKNMAKDAKHIEDKAQKAEKLNFLKTLPDMRVGSFASYLHDMVDELSNENQN